MDVHCDKTQCFYYVEGKCSNIAAADSMNCELFLDSKNGRVWNSSMIPDESHHFVNGGKKASA